MNDRRIRETVNAGARTVGQVGRSCGAGTCCGGCVRAIAEIVEEAETRPATVHELVPAARPLPIAAE